MTFILIFVAASFTASTLVVSACVLSSRISKDQPWEEAYEMEPEMNLHSARQTTA